MRVELDQVLNSDYLDGLDGRDIGAVRSMRDQCVRLETGLSFVRRVVQGRLDILRSEMFADNERSESLSEQELVSRLAGALSDHEGPRITGGRLVAPVSEVGNVDEYLDRIEELSRGGLGGDGPTEANPAVQIRVSLEQLEREVSAARRQLHGRIDTLHAEISRRYQSGEATVQQLLATTAVSAPTK